MSKRKIIIAVVISIIVIGVGALYANSLNGEAMSKAIAYYNKEVLKTQREKITEQIQAIDEKLGVANATDTGTVSK